MWTVDTINDEPAHDAQAILSLAELLGHMNELQIFIEDTETAYIHEILYKRVLSEVVTFDHLYPVGGKDKLIEAFQASLSEPEVPRVFIADLDYDNLLGTNLINHERFIYLDRYCLENYLVDEYPGALFLCGRTKGSLERARKTVNFRRWLEEIQDQFRPLVLLFLTIQAHRLGIPNSGESEGRFLESKSWRVDLGDVSSYEATVRRAYDASPRRVTLETAVSEAGTNVDLVYGTELWRAIPGKHLLHSFLRYLVGFSRTKQMFVDDFMVLAANHCDVRALEFVKNRVAVVMQSYMTGRHSETA